MPLDEQQDIGQIKDIALLRLEQAKEELDNAVFCLENKRYKTANNRAYYAIYKAVIACLATQNESYKSHAQTLGAFNKNFVHTGIFPKDMSRRIAKAEEVRHKSDYDDFYVVSIPQTEAQVKTAKEFIKLAEKYLSETLSI